MDPERKRISKPTDDIASPLRSIVDQIKDNVVAIHRYVTRLVLLLAAFGGFIIGFIIGRAT